MRPLKIYKSSAGSGKTYTLVKEYLKLCLPNPDNFRKVVAITFTNAAAAEMKDRIIKQLRKLAENGDEDFKRQLLAEGLREKDIKNAGKLLENILNKYSYFNVSTIDSFFQKILRAFNKELNLPIDFELSMDSDEVLDFTVSNFISQSNEKAEVQELMVAYIREKISNTKSWQVRSDLQKIARELLKDTSLSIVPEGVEKTKALIAAIKKITAEFQRDMKAIGKEATDKIASTGFEAKDFKYGASGPFGYLINISEKEDYEPKTRFMNGLEDISEWFNKKPSPSPDLEQLLEDEIHPLARKAYDYYTVNYPHFVTAKEVLKNIYTYAVYEELQTILTAFKNDNETVLISDANRVLGAHLETERIAFIYSKIGAYYDNYLIDEFQDTSRLQWKNLKPLVENSISQGNTSLLVGDSKQAIYRWRGGEVELIERQAGEEDFPSFFEKRTLDDNYRSKGEIVKFNNFFFNKIDTRFNLQQSENDGDNMQLLLESIFSDVSQNIKARENEGGYIEVNFIRKETNNREEGFLTPSNQIILKTITDCLTSGYSLKDIVILVRDKNDAGAVSKFLFANQIKFISQDSLFLDKSPAIRLLLSILHYIADQRNTIAYAEILFIYLQYFTKNENQLNTSDIFTGLSANKHLYDKLLPAEFISNLPTLSALPIYELTEDLIRIFGLNKEPDAYLQCFQDVVLSYTIKKGNNIRIFLDDWKENKYAVTLPENQDAVRIITIHKCKGLEFPVVIIPYADWQFRAKGQDIMWVHTDLPPYEEFNSLPVNINKGLLNSYFSNEFQRDEGLNKIDNLNLLYVAFTRAKNRLYINCPIPKKEPEEINSIGSLINSVISPEIKDNENIVQVKYGIPDVINNEGRSKETEPEPLPKYPAGKWRKNMPEALFQKIKERLIKTDSIDGFYKTDALEATQTEENEALKPILQMPEVKLFYGKDIPPVELPEMILPEAGPYKADKAVVSNDIIYVMKIVEGIADEKDKTYLDIYCGTLETSRGKEVRGCLVPVLIPGYYSIKA